MWTDTVNRTRHGDTGARSAQALIRFAKKSALRSPGRPCDKRRPDRGPRVVEHMVDAVLSFEGEGSQQVGSARGQEPFGPTDEIGVFEIRAWACAKSPIRRAVFVRARSRQSGTAVFRRYRRHPPVLVNLQALVAPTRSAPAPRVVGWIRAGFRCAAVLEAHCGVKRPYDVYLDVAGGLANPGAAADLAAAAALVSSLVNAPLPTDRCISARFRCRRVSARWRKPRPASRKRQNSDSAAPCCPNRRAVDVGGDSGLVLIPWWINQPGRGYRGARHSARNRPGKQGRRGDREKCHTCEDSGVRRLAGVTLPPSPYTPARKAR